MTLCAKPSWRTNDANSKLFCWSALIPINDDDSRIRWGGWATATTTVDTYEVGTLIVDLFDMSTKRVVWRGVATGTIAEKPEKNVKKIDKAVGKMFKHFPPNLT
jgi:hypothetical protein